SVLSLSMQTVDVTSIIYCQHNNKDLKKVLVSWKLNTTVDNSKKNLFKKKKNSKKNLVANVFT
ncbi:hypothetical protein ACJX0J_034275, partial [Zea mays]